MRSVDIEELGDKFDEYFHLVASETVLITENGLVVAELRPPRPEHPVQSRT
jgi:hypothetical protein